MARKKSHEEFKSLSEKQQEEVVSFLQTGKNFIILENPDTKQRVLLTHGGMGSLDPITASLMQTTGDRINPAGSVNQVDGVDYQLHGHMHWQYSGDSSGTVINIDSGCCYGEYLTAINAFDPDISIKVSAYV